MLLTKETVIYKNLAGYHKMVSLKAPELFKLQSIYSCILYCFWHNLTVPYRVFIGKMRYLKTYTSQKTKQIATVQIKFFKEFQTV